MSTPHPSPPPGYPVHLVHLAGQRVLVVGGGAVAAEKLPALLRSQAVVEIVAPRVGAGVAALADQLILTLRRFHPTDVDGARLVLAATDDRDVNAQVVAQARRRGVLANAVDDPELCDFYVPASLCRGPALISVSTDGGSPILAGRLRRMLEALLPTGLADVGQLLVAARRRGLRGLSRRSAILRALASPVVAGWIDRGDDEAAFAAIEAIAEGEAEPFEPGSVSIVGAGPGSRAHLTLRALDRLQRADVVLHDALVDSDVLALVPPGVRREQVGRRCASEAGGVRQPTRVERVARVVAEARAGHRVVRLHAGDPSVFGCGGEEMAALDAACVPFEVVPGVSAVLASAAAAGVPLTQRGVARGFSVRTGHTQEGPTHGRLPPEQETVVVLMGLGGLEGVLQGLIDEGRPASTPAVAVCSAARAQQRVIGGTLSDLAPRVRAAGLRSPTTLIVGEATRRAVAHAVAGGRAAPGDVASGHDEAPARARAPEEVAA